MDLLPLVQKVEKGRGAFRCGGKVFACETGPHSICIYKNKKEIEPRQADYTGKAEGYTLNITPKNITVSAKDYAGLYYGIQTFNQLVEDSDLLPSMKIIDYPDVSLRGIHFDLKGNLPKFERMKKIIENMGAFKLNTILLEYEDKFPYKSHPKIVSSLALTRPEIEELKTIAAYNAVQIIPLVQCSGHVEYILKHKKYYGLMEDNRFLNEFCLSDKRAVGVFKELALEVMEMHRDAKYFHIGADEVWNMGSCPKCKRSAKIKGLEKFYIDYVSGICDFVNEQGKTPIIWDDCFRKASVAELKKISKKAVLMYWKYGTNSYTKEAEQYPDLKLFQKAGVRLTGASAISGADGPTATCVNNTMRLENNLSWAQTSKKYGMLGVVGTAWTRYNGIQPPAEALEVAWMPALAEAEFLWKTPKNNDFSDFNRRFVKRFYGVVSPELSKAHYLIENDNKKAFEARELFKKHKKSVTKNADIIELMEVSSEITEVKEHLKWLLTWELELSWYRHKHYVLYKQEKKDKITKCLKAKKVITRLMKKIEEVYSKFLKAPEAREFALSRFALEEQKINDHLKFLKNKTAK